MRTRIGEEFTALGTGVLPDPAAGVGPQITTLSVEIDIDAAAVGPALSAKAVQSDPRPVGEIIKTRLFTYNPAAAGEFEISDFLDPCDL